MIDFVCIVIQVVTFIRSVHAAHWKFGNENFGLIIWITRYVRHIINAIRGVSYVVGRPLLDACELIDNAGVQ